MTQSSYTDIYATWAFPPSQYHTIPHRSYDGQYSDGFIPNFASWSNVKTTQLPPPIVEPTQPKRRKRASKPKVRTGCTTCKIRRVKCDEGKPNCLRCTSTGRKCDGYEFVRKESSDIVAPVRPPSRKGTVPQLYVPSPLVPSDQVFEGTVQERRAFYRFQFRTVPAFAGGSEADFWNTLVLQTCLREPVIRSAVIALGTLHEDYEERGGCYHQNIVVETSHQDATVLYGKAIRQLYRRIDRSPGETARLAIIASILFTCFEVLRRNNMAAVVHYQSGMRELVRQVNHRQQQAALTSGNGEISKRALVRQRPQDDLDRMLRVFARYDIQASCFAVPKAVPLATDLPPSPPMTMTLEQVRRYLDNLLIAVYQTVKSDLGMFRYWKAEDVSPSFHIQRDEALEKFQGWLDVLEDNLPSDAMTIRKHGMIEAKTLLGLLLQIKTAMIMLKTCIDCGPETTFDNYYDEFEEMVVRVENMTDALGVEEVDPLAVESAPFSMELGVVHPLFFVACKCRDWSLRRRAIVQLRKAGKEGVFEGPIMAVVAKRMMQIETRGLQEGQFVPELARIHDLRKTVEYDSRVVLAEMKLAQDDSWKKWKMKQEAIRF